MTNPRILVFAGSTRTDSYTKKLARVAADGVRKAGGEATFLDLRDLELPLYDGDLEDTQGLPPGGRKFKDLLVAHHGFIISSPEYNSSISAALKNAIDWASRPVDGQPPLEAFDGKVAALLGASPGSLGGLRGLVHLRAILGNIGVIVLPDQIAVSKAHEAFNDDGKMTNPKQQSQIEGFAADLVAFVQKLIA